MSTTPEGGFCSVAAYPAGRTKTSVAPYSAATEIGVLLEIAPSIKMRPAISTAGKIPGNAELARTALTTFPEERTTCSPVRMSVAINRQVIFVSPRVV